MDFELKSAHIRSGDLTVASFSSLSRTERRDNKVPAPYPTARRGFGDAKRELGILNYEFWMEEFELGALGGLAVNLFFRGFGVSGNQKSKIKHQKSFPGGVGFSGRKGSRKTEEAQALTPAPLSLTIQNF